MNTKEKFLRNLKESPREQAIEDLSKISEEWFAMDKRIRELCDVLEIDDIGLEFSCADSFNDWVRGQT